jgi:hypothetical protein
MSEAVKPFDAQRFAELQRAADVRGYIVTLLGNDPQRPVYAVYRWGLQAELDSLDKLEQWLRRAGVEVLR